MWQARKIAERVSSVNLGLHAALDLDRQLTPTLPGLTVGRSLKLLDGLIVAADPRAAEERAETQHRRRWIRIQPTTDGVTWLDGKLTHADGKHLDGTLNRIAAILKTTGDTNDRDTRRSSAIGILANPALALALLQRESQLPAPPTAEVPAASGRGDVTGRDSVAQVPGMPDPGVQDAAGDGDTRSPELERLLGELGPLLATIDPKKLLPKSTLYVHVSDRAIRNHRGVARIEGIGPVPVTQLRHLLTGTRIHIQPVFDPGGVTPVDSYEIPRPMRRAMILRQPVDTFPFGSWPSRGLDLDHTQPYRTDGGPDQTRLDNLGPLTRRPHRAKTHDRWQVLQPITGCYLWRSPLGLTYWRTADGRTIPLGWTPALTSTTPTSAPSSSGLTASSPSLDSSPAHDPPPE